CNVRMRHQQDGRRPPRCRRYSADALGTAYRHHLMVGQEWHQVLGHANRPHTRATATMRYTECFMQVEVTDIGSDASRAGEAHLCVHIGTVHINLSAVLVNNLTYFDN